MTVVGFGIEIEIEAAFEFVAFDGGGNQTGGIAVNVLTGVVFILPYGGIGGHGHSAGEGEHGHCGHFVNAFGVLGLDEDFGVGFIHLIGLTVGVTEIVGGGVGGEVELIGFFADVGRDHDAVIILGLEGFGKGSERGGVLPDIHEEIDEVKFDGSVVKPVTKKIYVMLNKPSGFVTTVSDDKGRPTVLELVSDIQDRLFPVGRLDYDTEGLLLLTNDGDLTYKITHPKNEIKKTYVAEVTGNISMETIIALRRGVVIDGYKTQPAEVEVVGATQFGTKLEITISEGRNRQVRKMFESQGCIVKKLKRTKEAGLMLGHLPLGKWRKLSESEINMLKKIGSEPKKRIYKKNYKKTIKNKNI